MLKRPLVCNYYLTLRCNDSCEFCSIWRDNEASAIEEAPLFYINKNLEDLKRLGVRYIDFTGGEPLLRADLPQILERSKEFGFYNSLTTNGILFHDRMHEIAPFVDLLLFSLDSPEKEEHDRIRGVDCFDQVLKGIEAAKGSVRKVIINCTLTRDTVLFLPEMVDLAESLGVMLWINPVYNYRGADGFTPESIDYIERYKSRKKVTFNWASMDLIRHGGNNINRPICRAANSTVTILPDDRLVLPCFYKQDFSARIEGNLADLYTKNAVRQIGKQGRFEECKGCLAWPYLNPSFLYNYDKRLILAGYSLWQLYAKMNKI